jgi:hypothetical protein
VSSNRILLGNRVDVDRRPRARRIESMVLGLTVALAACVLSGRSATAEAPALLAPPLLLVGVILPESGDPMAILEDAKTREQGLYALGAQIGGVRLTGILRDRVILTSGGVPIEVRLAHPSLPLPGRAIPPRPRFGRARGMIPR